ncbi:MAG: glycosyltransferase [Caulobacteraceae bacterium]
MTASAPPVAGPAEFLERLSEWLEAPAAERPDAADLVALHQALVDCDPAVLDDVIERGVAGARVNAGAAVGLLESEAALGFTPGGLKLADTLAGRFEDDERFADLQLRFQFALGRHQALFRLIERLLDRGLKTAQVAYRVVRSINRSKAADQTIGETLRYRAATQFLDVVENSAERDLWLGRYYREMANTIVGLRHYLAAWESLPDDNAFKAVALGEGADLALSGDRWGRDAPILLRAREAEIGSTLPWRAQAVERAFDYVGAGHDLGPHANLPGTQVYSHLFSMLGTPEIAFDYLLDETLRSRVPYEPVDCLLMFGTSLAGGGMERIFANSYRAVSAAGAFERVRMALLNFAPGAPSAFYLAESGAAAGDITALSGQGVPEFPVSLLPIGLGRRVWDAYQLILRERPRIVHAWNDLPGIVAAYAGLLAGCPRIFVHFHHMRAINLSSDRNLVRSYPYCYRRLLERPEIELLFVADASANDYADWWSVARSAKFHRLFNGFAEPEGGIPERAAARRAFDLPPDALIMGAVFRFHAVKRPLLWIEAARAVHQALPNAIFIMVGDGALWEEARARVAALGLEAVFHFPGQVKNVADYLACFDLFMLTSSSEGLPNSLVEAQLAGVPVLATDAGGARETFVPGVTGRLAPDASAETLAAAAVACLTDEVWRAAARARSREHALRVFGIDAYMKNLMAVYGSAPAPEKTGD